jgi:succinate dehydrogenase / fumarate reductase flavoprotein subunit
MQGAGDGYFILPYTISNYLASEIKTPRINTDTIEFQEAEARSAEKIKRLLSIKGKQTATTFHKKLGKIMWDHCGMTRNEKGLTEAIGLIRELREEFWKDLNVPGRADELNQELEKAGRVADFLELGELMITDALNRRECCGAHFREESQTPDHEALRNDDEYAYVAVWEYNGDQPPILHKEELKFEFVELKQRSYK